MPKRRRCGLRRALAAVGVTCGNAGGEPAVSIHKWCLVGRVRGRGCGRQLWRMKELLRMTPEGAEGVLSMSAERVHRDWLSLGAK